MADEPQDQPYVDPDHRVPDEHWGDAVRRAQKYRAESSESETK